MKKQKVSIHFIGCIILTLISISRCTTPTNDKTILKQFINCQNADSMIEYFQKNESHIQPNFLSSAIQILKRNKKDEEVKKLDSFYTTYLKTSGNDVIKFYYQLDRAYTSLAAQKFDVCDSQIKAMQYLKKDFHDSTVEMVYNTYLGTYLFVKNEYDSANKIFLKAYYISVSLKDDAYCERICNNLGSLALRMKQYRNSRYFLSKALKIMKARKADNPILVSNLATAYMSEGNFEQAKRTLLVEMEAKNVKSPYSDQLLKLNLAMAYQNLNEFNESKKIINNISKDSINASLKAPYLIIQLAQTIPNGRNEIQKFIKNHQNQLYQNKETLLEFYSHGLKKIIESYPDLLNEFGFSQTSFQSNSQENWNFEIHEILATLFQNKGQLQEAYKQKSLSNIALIERTSKQKINMSSEIDLALQNIELESSNAVLESENKFKSSQIFLTNIILTLAVILLGIIIFSWKRNSRIQQSQISIAKELLNSKLESERLQTNENKLNEKLMALSKLIVEKSISFAEKLRHSDVAKNPKIVEVRRGLEKLAELDQTFEQTRSEFGNESMYKSIWEKYADLNQLSPNAKKVLLLTLQSYKPKEIASMLDLSYDYVRNIKTKLNQIFMKNNISGYEELNELIQNKSEA